MFTSTLNLALCASTLLINGALAVPKPDIHARHAEAHDADASAPASSAAPADPAAATSNFWAVAAGPTIAAVSSRDAPGAAPSAAAAPAAPTAPAAPAAPASSAAAGAPAPAAAAPAPADTVKSFDLTPDALSKIAPDAGSCNGVTSKYGPPNQCRTAHDAAPFIANSFKKYGITHPSVQAALVATMLVESVSFKYNYHQVSDNGQGTRNMMSKQFVDEYAKSLNMSADQVFADDNASFGSAAWYVTTYCPFSIRQNMWGGKQDAFATYVTSCLGAPAPVEQQRIDKWQAATKVMGTA